MAVATSNTKAVDLAVAHCEAWSNHDWETARKALADDVIASAGDERNALVQLTAQMDGPPFGPLTWHGARLYLFDEDDKIREEQVIFVGVPR
jgi:hypothetical protein